MSLPRSKSQRMNLDDAYVSSTAAHGQGRLDALMAKGSSYAEVNLTYVGGKITGGSIQSNAGTSRILRGSLNGGRGISTHNRLVMKTSTGTVVTHLDLVRALSASHRLSVCYFAVRSSATFFTMKIGRIR